MSHTAVDLDIFVDARQRPAMLVRGLPGAAPWHDGEAEYPVVHDMLRRSHEALLDALEHISSAGWMHPQPEGLQEPGQEWRVFDLGAACRRDAADRESEGSGGGGGGGGSAQDDDEGNDDRGRDGRLRRSLRPVCALLSRLRGMGAEGSPPFAPLKAQFSTMAPGVHVRPHTGPTNAKLTLHYGLAVPDGSSSTAGARMRVADEVRPFVQGGLLAFDDSFEHEVWQGGSTPRTTLVLHVAHPGLRTGGGHSVESVADAVHSSSSGGSI